MRLLVGSAEAGGGEHGYRDSVGFRFQHKIQSVPLPMISPEQMISELTSVRLESVWLWRL